MRLNHFTLTAMLLLVSCNVFAECTGNMRLSVIGNPTDILSDNSVWIPVQLDVDEEIQSCGRFIYLSSTKSGRLLAYNKGQEHSLEVRQNNKGISPKELGQYRLKLSDRRSTSFWLKMRRKEQLSFAKQGQYAGEIGVRVNSPNATLNPLDYDFFINPKASLSISQGKNVKLSGTGNFVVADLGELKTNNEHQLIVKVYSNAKVSLALKSKYGHLQHKRMKDQSVRYSVKLDGHSMPSNNSGLIRVGQINKTKDIPLTIKLGDTRFAAAGTYDEVLSVTIDAY
ncbi:hypothetical protein FCV82_07870 [Vibrio breoganii]|uniref:Spore coat protein U domain-containing protein n=4 Tax=Vibrio breoganii TaxID=553239 RepID=A0AAP8MU11_9VIBR|nr:hypothetical protein [Vibrio breoganii]OED96538.1 hypothetical protein A1QG_14830 [Vibrio breoganii ZF-29]NMO74590.1 hypothetical protein [Vibrio breoganii]NMR69902.1 hypothetical protein [Vibrio breoganii]OEF81617.1 hypothetical protein B003_12345 [Vibrio breoganii 1C10]PMF76576.1 hypothetical protein BCV08_17050 [Vibrio breoganii]